jgi:hypothetical protein
LDPLIKSHPGGHSPPWSLLIEAVNLDVLGRAVDLANQQVAGVDAEIVVGVIDGPRAWRWESNSSQKYLKF